MNGSGYRHVAFDLDGTLVDSRADLAGAVNHALRRLGLPERPPDVLAGYVGDGARALVERALGPAHRDRLGDALALFLEHYGAHLLDTTRPYPGIPDALDALAARGVLLSVLTNKPEGLSRAIVEGLGLAPRFVAVVGGDTLPTKKPDPAGLHHLRALTGTAADRTCLVGDSGIDVATARAAGTAFCGVSWGFVPHALRAAGPERIADDPAALVELAGG